VDRGRRDQVRDDLKSTQKKLVEAENRQTELDEAHAIIQTVAQATQDQRDRRGHREIQVQQATQDHKDQQEILVQQDQWGHREIQVQLGRRGQTA